MHSDIQDQMHELEELRLPELRARFAEIVGEPTRTPNKQYLLRRIAEALEAKQADGGTVSGDDSEHMTHDDGAAEPEPIDDDGEADGDGESTTTTDLTDIKLTRLTIPELQERYRQTIGRDTRSTSAAYLQWKIRQAEKGRVRIGPVQRRTAEGRAQGAAATHGGQDRNRAGRGPRSAGPGEPHGAHSARAARLPRPGG